MPAYSLTLFCDAESIVATLCGPDDLAILGRMALSASVLAATTSASATAQLDPDPARPEVRRLGSSIFNQLLPANVGQFLFECPAGELRILVDSGLLGIAWPLAFNGQEDLGHRFRTTVAPIRSAAPTAPTASARRLPWAPTHAAGSDEPDHLRQVTVVSYDLVDSTLLMTRIGSERYSEILERFHETCAEIVAKWGGVAGDPQGNDGLMCYFGLPVAREDTAANALRAGLEIVQAVEPLQVKVRIGIATGAVVVKARQPVGVAVHLAARLQSIAAPGTVVVSAATRSIVKGNFEFQPLDRVPNLKGIDRPGAVYQLLPHSNDVPQTIEHPQREASLAGRHAELGLLSAQWALTRSDHMLRVVIVTGEAGIGKSRLVREFRRALAAAEDRLLECRCFAEHASSAFFPLIDLMVRWHRIRAGESPARTRRKLATALGDSAPDAMLVDVLMELVRSAATGLSTLSQEAGDQTKSILAQVSPDRQRQLIHAALRTWLNGQAGEGGALCLLLEDVQWLDPSSFAFLRQEVERTTLPMLLVSTQRPDPRRTIGFSDQETGLELKGLPRDAAYRMVVEACRDTPLPADVIEHLVDKSDGVPLFIEESTRMLLDTGMQQTALALGPGVRIDVPSSLHDLLMARLDRMGGEKQLAQVAALLGREFSLATLLAVLESPAVAYDASRAELGLHQLVEAGLLVEKGELLQRSYYFRHALIQDVAVQSLLVRDRRRLHGTIAQILRDLMWGQSESKPETLAWHFAEAGDAEQAIVHLEVAARQAVIRSAHQETVGFLESALAQVQSLPADAPRDATELRLQLTLAGQLVATVGYGAPKVQQGYERAMLLARSLGDDRAQLKAMLGLEGYYFMHAEFALAREMAERAGVLARAAGDAARAMQCDWAIANIQFHKGELSDAVARMDDCLLRYEARPHRLAVVQDPGVMCLCYSALAQWELGESDDALRRAVAAVDLASKLNHKFSQGEAWGFRALVHYFRREFSLALDCAVTSRIICEEGGFTVWLAHAKLMFGRITAEMGDAVKGIREMQEGYALWVGSGAQVTRPLYLVFLAEGYALNQQFEFALDLAGEALDMARRHDERYFEAEIERVVVDLQMRLALSTGAAMAPELASRLQHAESLARSRGLRGVAGNVVATMERYRALGHQAVK